MRVSIQPEPYLERWSVPKFFPDSETEFSERYWLIVLDELHLRIGLVSDNQAGRKGEQRSSYPCRPPGLDDFLSQSGSTAFF